MSVDTVRLVIAVNYSYIQGMPVSPKNPYLGRYQNGIPGIPIHYQNLYIFLHTGFLKNNIMGIRKMLPEFDPVILQFEF